MDRQSFTAAFNVPRGTIERLEHYERMLIDWQGRMNLVGPATLSDMWFRHFADSAQLTRHVPRGLLWLDIGAGGGFPGMVLAAMDWGRIVLVDSVAKKCRFLDAVRAELGLEGAATILNARIENLPTLGVDVATARAAAPLATLFDWAIRHVRPGGRFVFLKGRRWADEVEDARKHFTFELDTHESLTDPDARVLVATHLKRL